LYLELQLERVAGSDFLASAGNQQGAIAGTLTRLLR
jgi:hypothetical protein